MQEIQIPPQAFNWMDQLPIGGAILVILVVVLWLGDKIVGRRMEASDERWQGAVRDLAASHEKVTQHQSDVYERSLERLFEMLPKSQ